MNPRSHRSRFRLSLSRRRVSTPGIPQNGARHCQPAPSRPASSPFNKDEFGALSIHTATQCYDEKSFIGILKSQCNSILKMIQAGVSFDKMEGQDLYCSRPPGSNADVSAPVCEFLMQLFPVFYMFA